jgi:hypothetical protein
MAGGAVASACREIARARQAIGAKLLQADPAEVKFRDGRVVGRPATSASPRSRAPGTCGRRICRPTSIAAGSRRRSATSRRAIPAPSATPRTPRSWRSIPRSATSRSSTTSSSRTAASWSTRWSSTARSMAARAGHRHRAVRGDAVRRAGQPLASTLADYLLPGPTEVPAPRLDHMETPSPYTEFGVRRASARAARSRRRRRSPTRSTTRCGRSAPSCCARRSRRARARGDRGRARSRPKGRSGGVKPARFDYERPRDARRGSALRGKTSRQKCWPAGSRSGRCSTCAWCSRTSSTSPRLPR